VVDVIDKRRRRLLIATTTLATAGVGFAAVPFVASMLPSERAKALGGPVEIDFNKLTPGELLTAAWRGKPVWIMRRTPPMLGQLGNNAPLLADPDSQVATQQPSYAKNLYRSIKPELLVMIGICTHLGCVPTPRFAVGEASGLGEGWPGGFFCPCHGSKFDLAGRVFKNVPAPTNLVVPPHHFVTDTQVVIGVDPLQRT
jgi:ubiquinol-cytochrome c reductase iron-sulfur subunit